MINIFKTILHYPKTTVALSLCFFLFAGLGLNNFKFITDYRYFFSEQNPDLQTFNDFQNRFGNSDNIFVVVKPDSASIFERTNLQLIEEFTASAWQTPHSTRVDSLSNFQHISVQEDEIFVEPLFQNSLMLDNKTIEQKKNYAASEPALNGFLISEDFSHSAINISIETPQDDDGSAQIEAVEFVEQLVSEFESKYPGSQFYVTGQLKINNAFIGAAQMDATTLIPTMFGLLILFLWLFLRSFTAMMGTLAVVLMSSGLGIGLALAIGIPMSSVATSAPLIILTLAVADSVHLLVSYFHELKLGKGQNQAMLNALEINLQPIFLTSITTVIGFLSLNFNESPPVRDMGNMVAIGVSGAFIFSVSFLPALMMLFKQKVKNINEGRPLWAEQFADFINRKANVLGLTLIAVTALFAWSASKNDLNDMLFEFFAEKLPARQEINYVNENMTGIMSLYYTVHSQKENGITNPSYLKTLDRFKQWLEQQPEVKHVNGFSDVIKRINRMLHNNDSAYAVIPDNRQMIAQDLLLYEMSLPFGMDLNNQIDFKKQSSNLRIQLDNIKTKQLIALQQRADSWLEQNASPGFKAEATGPDYMFARITFRTIQSMAIGTTVAIVLISLCLIIALKSWKLGFISLISNFAPLILTFGAWAIIVGEVGLIASSVAVIGLGLIVDDTVHFLSKYQRAKNKLKYNFEDSIQYAFSRVASALLITSVILSLGFAILGYSSFKPNMQMGLLTSMTIGFALITTFALLPALLRWFDYKSKLDLRQRFPQPTTKTTVAEPAVP